LQVGQTIARIDASDGAVAEAPADAIASEAEASEAEASDAKTAEPEPQPAPSTAAPAAESAAVIDFKPAPPRSDLGDPVPAAPSARALARQLGVDIAEVPGSGPGGRITREDVKARAKVLIRGAAGAGSPASPGVQPELPDFGQWGEVEREPLSSVRRATARAMANSWNSVPHVTQFDHADITQLESMRKRFNARPEVAERKLSMTAIVIKMVASVLRQFPKFNASLDLAGDAVIYKKYVHVGVAVDTERGLLVPVIRDADRKNLVEIASELGELARRAREKKVGLDELRGASFTVTNLGGLGTTYFSPIVNWPEVAILGVGRAEQQAVLEDGQFQPRLILPLSISYDHRLIDGADAARFLRRLAEALEQPLLLLLDD
jgi:pyruvate dehydrogenase E2 component (dihydrolipoamide acetyltransferase)